MAKSKTAQEVMSLYSSLTANEKGCIEWPKNRNPDGYGMVYVNNKAMGAHRFIWIQKRGDIPMGLCVLHDCDNPSCVNINHLHLGTHQDNMDERNERGRARGGRTLGSAHPGSKITEVQVLEIRDKAARMSQREIAMEYGIIQQTVSLIVNRKTWPHI